MAPSSCLAPSLLPCYLEWESIYLLHRENKEQKRGKEGVHSGLVDYDEGAMSVPFFQSSFYGTKKLRVEDIRSSLYTSKGKRLGGKGGGVMQSWPPNSFLEGRYQRLKKSSISYFYKSFGRYCYAIFPAYLRTSI
jgi:hypothetical protein